ncbi:hypothetical protein R3P38DRAFT_2770345 [Favolaschia claudopus]|uniref:Uncharacterized protein n=1 Tax=Favolaschia claudopus TaxID=2862362 RepID=A0AAW0CG06_9AGAR
MSSRSFSSSSVSLAPAAPHSLSIPTLGGHRFPVLGDVIVLWTKHTRRGCLQKNRGAAGWENDDGEADIATQTTGSSATPAHPPTPPPASASSRPPPSPRRSRADYRCQRIRCECGQWVGGVVTIASRVNIAQVTPAITLTLQRISTTFCLMKKERKEARTKEGNEKGRDGCDSGWTAAAADMIVRLWIKTGDMESNLPVDEAAQLELQNG